MSDPARMLNPQSQDDLLLYRLYRIQATAGPLVVRMCERDYGITRREWRLLSCVADAEGLQSSELAQQAGLDRARTSRTLTRLVEKGLARREPKPSDRREVHVFLTEQGQQVRAQVLPRIAAIQRELLAPFGLPEQALLDNLLTRLMARAQELNPDGDLLPPLEDTAD